MVAAGGSRKPRSGISKAIRHELVVLARRSNSRSARFRRDRPTDWRPHEVRNPSGGLATHFTDPSAWELIASRLEQGEPVEVIELHTPKGAKGYVMKIHLGRDVPLLYVKLQIGSGRIFGRSFHYSEHE